MVKCPNCGHRLKEVGREKALDEPEFVDMSDEELIDYFGEEITGNYDQYGVTMVHFKCEECGKRYNMKEK